ncbi:MAG TPA: heavy metal-binding domain-containing protein [Saprospiraceae bacterium]|nr:heavy metal-binding domain-containing protein [Saprospiraceae bacterium]
MKKGVFFLTMLVFGGFMLFTDCRPSRKLSAEDSSYACPNHPEVTGFNGDRCTKCQAKMVVSRAPAIFCCPVHKECTSKISGKCPKCGTPLEQPVQPWICPMHPDQKGHKGERCPKCNMPLEAPKPGKGVG